MNVIVILLALLCLVWAYPHDVHESHEHHEFLDLVASIATSIKPNGISDEIAKLAPAELLDCVSKKEREAIHRVCEHMLMNKPHYIYPMTAECILVDFIKALDNVTGIINITNLKKNTLEFTSISVDQKAKASASIESCIESNFTLPHPPHSKTEGTRGHPHHHTGNEKPIYENRNNPMRAMVCVAKSLIENGCASVKADRVTRSSIYLGKDSASGENSADYGSYEDYYY